MKLDKRERAMPPLSKARNSGLPKPSATARWAAMTRFVEDGRLDMTNNAAERAIRPIAIGRNNWTFAGSDTGGERAALMFTLIESAKMNGLDPEAYLRQVIGRIADHPARRIAKLLPWNVGYEPPAHL